MGNEDTHKQTPRQDISDEAIFKGAKEVVVKFIEAGRLTPSSFAETFDQIYKAIEQTVRSR
jgi:hypothetical protein